jgi:hypothetical protein
VDVHPHGLVSPGRNVEESFPELDTLNIRRGTGATILSRVLTKMGEQQQRRRFVVSVAADDFVASTYRI